MKYKIHISLVFLLTILSARFVNAQTDNDIKSKLAQIKNYRSTQLDNGLTVICLTTHNTDKFFIRSYTDVPGYVSKNYQSLLLVDTELRKSTDFNLPANWKQSDLQGLNITIGRDDKGVYASCPPENLNKTIGLFADIFQNPKIEASEIHKAKQDILSYSKKLEGMPNDKIDKITKSIIYGKQHPILKKLDIESLNKISLKEYQEFYNRFYKPNNSYLLVMGNISLDSVKTLTNNTLKEWKNKDLPKSEYKLVPIKEPKIVFFDTVPTGKPNIKILFPFALHPFTFNSEKAELLSVLFQDLLSDKLISELKLANKIEAKFESDKITGNYQLNVHLNSDSINNVIEAIIETISKLRKAEYPVEKLAQAKKKIISDFTKQEVNDQFISRLVMISETENLPKEYYAEFIDDINNTDKQNIRIFAAKYLNYNTSLFQIPGNWYKSLNDFIKLCKNFRIELYALNGKLNKVIPKGFNGFSVINNYVEAVGGVNTIKKLKNVKIEYGMVYNLPDGTNTIVEGEFLHQNGNKFLSVAHIIRPEFRDTVFLRRQIYDGKLGLDSTSTGSKLLSGNELKLLQYRAPIFPEMFYKQWDYKAVLTKADTIWGTHVWVVNITNPANQAITDFYDVDKGLRIKRVIQDNSYFAKRTITYHKYTKTGKKQIIYPFFKKIVSGNTTIKMIIGNVDLRAKSVKDLSSVKKLLHQ